MKGQGAIELCSGTTAGTLQGQGATEYLVLLAVVLIVALVSVALLGFFPGMASDAQVTQSKAYWSSTSPLQLVETGARIYSASPTNTAPYLRIKNAGMYRVKVTKLLAGSNSISQLYSYTTGLPIQISDFLDLAPGEEKSVAHSDFFSGISNGAYFWFIISGGAAVHQLNGASSVCTTDTANTGQLVVPSFGFEYIEYIDGQQITKREIGAKPLIIKCREPA